MSKELDFMIVAYTCPFCTEYVLVHLDDYDVVYEIHDDNGIYIDLKCPSCGRKASITLKEAE